MKIRSGTGPNVPLAALMTKMLHLAPKSLEMCVYTSFDPALSNTYELRLSLVNYIRNIIPNWRVLSGLSKKEPNIEPATLIAYK